MSEEVRVDNEEESEEFRLRKRLREEHHARENPVVVDLGKNLVEPLTIRIWPDPVLREKASKIEEITEWHQELAGRMAGMMRKPSEIEFADQKLIIEPGIGLSAPQVGHSLALIVLETDEQDSASAIVNPEIVWRSKKQTSMYEGCLSFPHLSSVVRAKIKRPQAIVVKAQALDGREVEIEASDMQARVIQHEVDHLNGVLFIDKFPPSKQAKLKKYLARLKLIYEAHKAFLKEQAEKLEEEPAAS